MLVMIDLYHANCSGQCLTQVDHNMVVVILCERLSTEQCPTQRQTIVCWWWTQLWTKSNPQTDNIMTVMIQRGETTQRAKSTMKMKSVKKELLFQRQVWGQWHDGDVCSVIRGSSYRQWPGQSCHSVHHAHLQQHVTVRRVQKLCRKGGGGGREGKGRVRHARWKEAQLESLLPTCSCKGFPPCISRHNDGGKPIDSRSFPMLAGRLLGFALWSR